MFERFQRAWNIARFVAILTGGVLYTISCNGHGFAPMLEFKGPSAEGERLKDREAKDRSEREYNKLQRLLEEARDAESNGQSAEDIYEKGNDIDWNEVSSYERDNFS